MIKTAFKCDECGKVYQEPTVCAGSPVIDGAISDYKVETHEPVGCGYVKVYLDEKEKFVGVVKEGKDQPREAVTVDWVLESEVPKPRANAATGKVETKKEPVKAGAK